MTLRQCARCLAFKHPGEFAGEGCDFDPDRNVCSPCLEDLRATWDESTREAADDKPQPHQPTKET